MKSILKKASRLETFLLSGISNTITVTFRSNEEIFIEMNTEDQLFEKGVDADGQSLANRAPYRPATISIKREKHQPTNRVTLRDTGEFHESFRIIYRSTDLEITADDWKAGDLIDKYGSILGWTDSNLNDIIRNYLLPELLKRIPR